MNRIALLVAAALSLLLTAPAARAQAAKPKAAAEGDRYAVFVTSRGKIGVRLLPAAAPNAVKNFVELATGKKDWTDPKTRQPVRVPLYDGTLFHRVIPGFMIQGGDPLTRGEPVGRNYAGFGTGSPGYRFDDEGLQAGTAPFAMPCQLAMANSGPNTNGSQFFITEVPTPHLNPRRCAESPSGVCGYVHLGEGVCGCDRVAEIARAGNSQTKLEKVEITSTKPSCR